MASLIYVCYDCVLEVGESLLEAILIEGIFDEIFIQLA